MVSSSMTGGRGEALVSAEFLRRGVAVYKPLVDTGADLVVDVNGKLLKVQVKSSISEERAVTFHLGRRNWRSAGWSDYATNAPDLYALCCFGHDYVALIPAGDKKNARFTFSPGWEERLKEFEIGTVIGRLVEESK